MSTIKKERCSGRGTISQGNVLGEEPLDKLIVWGYILLGKGMVQSINDQQRKWSENGTVWQGNGLGNKLTRRNGKKIVQKKDQYVRSARQRNCSGMNC